MLNTKRVRLTLPLPMAFLPWLKPQRHQKRLIALWKLANLNLSPLHRMRRQYPVLLKRFRFQFQKGLPMGDVLM